PPTAIPPTQTAVPPTHTAVPTLTSPPPTPPPDPYAGLSIEALAARGYGGGQLDIVDTLAETDTLTRYLFTYPSDGLTIYGYLTVPNEGARFPVVIMLHGYIPPDEYETVAYTRRYADALAEAGYFVIHPNLRNYPPSDAGADPFRIGMAVDVLNLIAIVRQQSQDPLGYLRRADADQIHLWGHSMGGGVALRVLVVQPADYLKTAVLYGSMSGDEALNYAQIRAWSGGARGDFELAAPPEALAAISPMNYLERLTAAVSIHHSDADDIVPLAWSEALCARLQALQKRVACHTYHAAPHTFNGPNDTLFMARVLAFFDGDG
ncbi:MAG: alpha/beta fold hydrolase, partial [Anaerolineales bacterium]|nr:alpha/beta fold hydrolase [Anaerolineales bacterium]